VAFIDLPSPSFSEVFSSAVVLTANRFACSSKNDSNLWPSRGARRLLELAEISSSSRGAGAENIVLSYKSVQWWWRS